MQSPFQTITLLLTVNVSVCALLEGERSDIVGELGASRHTISVKKFTLLHGVAFKC